MKDTELRASIILDRQVWDKFRGWCKISGFNAFIKVENMMLEYIENCELEYQKVDNSKKNNKS